MKRDAATEALLTDLYQLTMVGGYVLKGKKDQKANFDYFFRKIPDNGGFCVMAGLEQLIDYICNLKFTEDDLAYLKGLDVFPEEVIAYLRHFSFSGDIYSVPEGTVAFPHEPLIRVTASLPEAQLIETALLNIVNFQTLLATKAARVCFAAEGSTVVDFGLRRAHGPNGGLMASRAMYVGGVNSTSNVLAGKKYGIPVAGTHAHSWIESFPTEIESFRAFAEVYSKNCILLVDTYDTLHSGLPHAIALGKELEKKGLHLLGIRLDSGDLAYLSKKAREELDRNGLNKTLIVASSDLDEWLIESLKKQGAKIDVWGVGTRLITSYTTPALGGVYKLTALDEDEKEMVPKIKRSDNPEKITNPGKKRLVRIVDGRNQIRGDILFLDEEEIPQKEPFLVFHPMYAHIKKRYPARFKKEELLTPIFKSGKLVYDIPPLEQVRENTLYNLSRLDEASKRFHNPHTYHVSLSQRLFEIKQHLLIHSGGGSRKS
jgi:nicotinate phosphoribosyltransferase